MRRRGFRAFPALVAILLAAAGCATDAPAPPLDAPTSALLEIRGAATFVPGNLPVEVVVVKDRHFVGGGLTYVDDDLRRLQHEHRRLVGDLADRGFRLLGAEWRKGPLPLDGAAEDHRAAVRDALAEGDDLDRWSIYQPIRYETEFQDRLEVIGVEEPALYDADVAALERLIELARAERRAGEADAAGRAERARLRRAMVGRIDDRGAAAARNLAEAMRDRRASKAILLLGAAHVPAASRTLQEMGVPHHVFTAPSFERRDAPPTDAR
jgi:hypothetical protein